MKVLILLFFLLPVTIFAQNYDPLGILGVEVSGNSAILINDSAWRNCGATYEMVVYQLEGDTIGWYQKGMGLTNCDCLFYLSVTLDSLDPGDYYVKTSFEDSYSGDTVYIGLITFTILEQNSFNGFVKTGEYQSPCGIVGTNDAEPNTLSLFIGPNPAYNRLTIRTSEGSGKTVFQIFKSNGQRIMNEEIGAGETEVDISRLAKGLYYVRVQKNLISEVRKIIKQ